MKLRPQFMATALASMPHRDVERACQLILENFPEAPVVPRLTRSTRMFLEGMPCLVVDSERRRLSFDLSPERESELVEFYDRYLADDVEYFAISPEWAPGMYHLLEYLQESPPPELKLVHFQTPGPVSWALSATDEKGAPAFYNETMRDVMVKTLAMKAKWQERKVRESLPGVQTLITFGEPALLVHTSAVGSGPREDIVNALNEVMAAVEGITCVHCCANIDWTILMGTNTDVINFDAYEYSDKIALYTQELKRYLERGGMLAWGIVPTFDEKVAQEDEASLEKRLEDAIDLMAARGLDRGLLLESSLVTPSCATSSMSVEAAERAFELAGRVSQRMRTKYSDIFTERGQS